LAASKGIMTEKDRRVGIEALSPSLRVFPSQPILYWTIRWLARAAHL